MKYLFISVLLMLTVGVFGQSYNSLSQKGETEKAIKQLSRSLQEGGSDEQLAVEYESTGREFIVNGDDVRGEEYLKRALQLYVKLNDREKQSFIEREIAKIKERQGQVAAAIAGYQNAAGLTQDKELQQLNLNDVSRLRNLSDLEAQSSFIRQNIELSNTIGNKEEYAFSNQQMAQVNIERKQTSAALENLEEVAKSMKDMPVQKMQAERMMADLYMEDNQLDKVIDINLQILDNAHEAGETRIKIEQLHILAGLYTQKGEYVTAMRMLEEAYQLAMENGHTLEALTSLKLLEKEYQKDRNNTRVVALYKDFITKLEDLIHADSELVKTRFFHLHEEKIDQLEKERLLKDELIRKKNVFNDILIGSIVVILLFVLFLIKVLATIRKKNKKIALQSLKREMNPHFIFNSLNSVNQFIAQNKELEANKYLTSYSRLMRNVMENSGTDFTLLVSEIDQLKEYLDLEYMRFQDKFSYEIKVDEALDTDRILIPNMLIQPQLENAIWHGLRYREEKGFLLLSFFQKGDFLIVRMDDNGIGLKKSQELKTDHQRVHQSRGLKNTYERIKLLNSLYRCKIRIEIVEKTGVESGVVVTLHFPLKY